VAEQQAVALATYGATLLAPLVALVERQAAEIAALHAQLAARPWWRFWPH